VRAAVGRRLTNSRTRPPCFKLARLAAAAVAATAALALGQVAPGAPGVPGAAAENNGVGLTPAMGWSSWSFLRHDPTAKKVEAQARALMSSGLAKVGYRYVNLDDFWYICPGSQGPKVDRYGRWVAKPNAFPPGPDGESGIAAVANFVHHLGLKFGLYVTPGISRQAVVKDTPILAANGRPSGYTADEIAERSVHEYNYNCGGMVGINYKAPGAQEFIDSWANEFASWGIDYLKLDGVGSFDIPDVKAWSEALRQTGRPVHLELSNSLDIHFASTWAKYSNGWRTGRDIECYACQTNGSSYPLTDYASVETRFDQVAAWRPDGKPGAFNDYDSIEIGNGAQDGLAVPERQTQLSLWALASSPLILGTDLTHLNRTDLAMLENRAVIAVDQDGIDASRVTKAANSQIFAKTETNGAVVVGLFNTSDRSRTLSLKATTLGLARAKNYEVVNLWSQQAVVWRNTASGAPGPPIDAHVPAHGVALLRVRPAP
jgi:Alpha galactosidase A/Alpha galactosidase C-terminal beta sandwich domain